MRGDRPSTFAKWKRTRRATPHARGSTTASRHHIRGANGYPACAGIDPGEGESRRTGTGLPRMRGDRPAAPLLVMPASGATPHARGSTSTNAAPLLVNRGYPACAGIDPSPRRSTFPLARLPRMRGDRPVPLSHFIPLGLATPHARGSTSALRPAISASCGYPACAGIDPSSRMPRHTWGGLPRMRGDRPQ